MKPPKVLLLGLGRWGRNHARVLRELGVDLYGADPVLHPDAARKDFGLDDDHFSARMADLLDRVDAVDIVTPADTHYELAVACLGAGKHVFVEKPPCIRRRELDDLERRARAAKRAVQVGFVFRFHPLTLRLKELASKGAFGRLRYLHGRFCGFKRPRSDVGVTFTDGIHFIDLAIHLMGRAPDGVHGAFTDFLRRGMDDMGHVTMTWGDAAAYVESGYWYPPAVQEFTVVGDEGAARAVFREGRIDRWTKGPASEGRVDRPDAEERPGGEEPLRAEFRSFFDAVANGKPPAVGIEDARSTLDAALRAYESADSEPCAKQPRTARRVARR